MDTLRVASGNGSDRSDATISLIGVVDDDESILDALSSLLRSAGYKCAVFPSAEVFLESGFLSETDCIVLDVQMPGMNGPDLQHKLQETNGAHPVIFITAHADERVRSRVLEEGAVAFLNKPFKDEELLDAIRLALDPSHRK